jgi:hypothetical protein
MEFAAALLQKYGNLLKNTHYVMQPAIQGDWRAPFRQPLFAPLDSFEYTSAWPDED